MYIRLKVFPQYFGERVAQCVIVINNNLLVNQCLCCHKPNTLIYCILIFNTIIHYISSYFLLVCAPHIDDADISHREKIVGGLARVFKEVKVYFKGFFSALCYHRHHQHHMFDLYILVKPGNCSLAYDWRHWKNIIRNKKKKEKMMS